MKARLVLQRSTRQHAAPEIDWAVARDLLRKQIRHRFIEHGMRECLGNLNKWNQHKGPLMQTRMRHSQVGRLHTLVTPQQDVEVN